MCADSVSVHIDTLGHAIYRVMALRSDATNIQELHHQEHVWSIHILSGGMVCRGRQ
jgi:hypothetical protein